MNEIDAEAKLLRFKRWLEDQIVICVEQCDETWAYDHILEKFREEFGHEIKLALIEEGL